MGLIIEVEDFSGKYEVKETNFDSADLYIDRYELKLMRELLGATLFDLFKVAYDADPTLDNTVFKVIFNAFNIDDKEGCENKVRSSRGMSAMLVGMVWFEYMRDLHIKITAGGAVVDKSEVSELVDPNFMYQRYNEAVEDYKNIQWYICKHKEDYPDYNGTKKSIAHWSL